MVLGKNSDFVKKKETKFSAIQRKLFFLRYSARKKGWGFTVEKWDEGLGVEGLRKSCNQGPESLTYLRTFFCAYVKKWPSFVITKPFKMPK